MIISAIKLFTNQLEAEKAFYHEVLGFEYLENTDKHFTVQVGHTRLTFEYTAAAHRYHYCFLIPSNQLDNAVTWLKERLDIYEIEPGRIVQRFESWNAESVYFHDGSGNLAEFIVRYDLNNGVSHPFSLSDIISLNEIGMPTNDVKALNTQLENKLHTSFWKGDLERFGTHGSQEGLFLLPNYEVKSTWFPSNVEIDLAPFEARVVNEGEIFNLKYKKGVVSFNG